jgi:hypothetical protein
MTHARKCATIPVADEQLEQTTNRRRGRPRKWPSEAARRKHEAAKRRLRNKTHLTPETFDDVVRLTALADNLRRRLEGAVKEVEQLRVRTRELEHRLAEASRLGRPSPQSIAEAPGPTPLSRMNRQQRREAERAQRRVDVQQRRAARPL